MAKTRIPADMLPEPPAERMAAARALWEGNPSVSIDAVAVECGVPVFWARRWKREQGWTKAGGAEMSDRAHQLADAFAQKAVENAPPEPEAAAEVARQIAAEVAVDHATDVRAQLLARQRQEWQAARRLAYEAIRDGQQGRITVAFERAKLAKIMAETLTLIQAGECRAHGITTKDVDDTQTIVIDRTTPAPQPEALPPATPVPAPYRSPERAIMAGAGDDDDGSEF